MIRTAKKPNNSAALLLARLAAISSLKFTSESQQETGWGGSGVGDVEVITENPSVLIFRESGVWTCDAQTTSTPNVSLRFRNTLRWSKVDQQTIRLEHLRLGTERPVQLIDFTSRGDRHWAAFDVHVCGQDIYSAELRLFKTQMRLDWKIVGPNKDESVRYTYFG